jgi:hypothetical protein
VNFRLTREFNLPRLLIPGSFDSVVVQFRPQRPGIDTARMIIADNGDCDSAIVLIGRAFGDAVSDAAETPRSSTLLTLSPPRPNPFAPGTSVRVDVGARWRAVVDVADALGRRVALVREAEFAAGSHEVSIDASGLSAGVYRVRVVAGGRIATQPLVVVR